MKKICESDKTWNKCDSLDSALDRSFLFQNFESLVRVESLTTNLVVENFYNFTQYLFIVCYF